MGDADHYEPIQAESETRLIDGIILLKKYSFSLAEISKMTLKQLNHFVGAARRHEQGAIAWQIKATQIGMHADSDKVDEVTQALRN